MLWICVVTVIFFGASCDSRSTPFQDISAEDMSERIYFLASDSMQGRYTPSSELEKVAEYIASEFKRINLDPGAPGNKYIMRYPLPTGDNTSAPNVVGILRGSDSLLADEYVIFSAHMDHLGVGQSVNGDSIYNGADDNASGTSAVLEIAEAMSLIQPRLKRSMIFLLVSGEEQDLLGSKWFVEYPTIPISSIVADLNIDMIGRNSRRHIVVIGKQESSLGSTVDRIAQVNPGLGLKAVDDMWPEQKFFYRSDHYSFARKGVPILFFFNGIHKDYHMPSDESDKIDFEKTARVARLIALTGLDIANAENRPVWDKDAYDRIVEKH
jgi:Zn-dependent M28 family amino/carboxypeptidase